MANYEVFSIKDTVVNEFDKQLFVERSRRRVYCNFMDSMRRSIKDYEDRQMTVPFRLSDYELYCLGTFDTETGLVTPYNTPVLIRAVDVDVDFDNMSKLDK